MSRDTTRDFDALTSFLGEYGFFQVRLMVLLSLISIPCGYMGILSVFTSDTPEFRCRESINSSSNATDAQWRNWTAADSCARSGLHGANTTELCEEGWVFITERYTSTVVSEWDLVCEHSWKVPLSTSLYFVGVLIGSFASGQLSDRFGRKPLLFSTMALHAVTALIQATSVNWIMFCFLNCLRGLGQMSTYVSTLILGCELLSPPARVNFSVLGHCLGFGIGYALLPLVAYFIRSWRMLLVASAVPSILFLSLWWVIPESPRWLLQRGRVEEAELIIRKAAKINNVAAPDVIFTSAEFYGLVLNEERDERDQSYNYLDLIRTHNIRNITIVGVFIWFSMSMIYFGLSLNTSNLNGNAHLNCFISAAIDIMAYVGSWLLINHVSRPISLSSSMIFCSISLLLMQLVPEDMPVLFQALALMGKLGVACAYAFVFIFFTELIPTVVRNMGMGINSGASIAGAIICPYVIYIGVYNKVLPYIVFGSFSIMAGVFTMFLPDTRNHKLPERLNETPKIRGCCCPKEAAAAQSHLAEASI